MSAAWGIRSCSHCLHYDEFEDYNEHFDCGLGWCTLHPPVMRVGLPKDDDINSPLSWAQPTVRDYDRCGSFTKLPDEEIGE